MERFRKALFPSWIRRRLQKKSDIAKEENDVVVSRFLEQYCPKEKPRLKLLFELYKKIFFRVIKGAADSIR
jgi:hypothetical protein